MATADGPDFHRVRGVATSDALNVRMEPDATSRKVGAIPPGANCVRNLGCQGGLSCQEFMALLAAKRKQRERENPRWCRIEYRGLTGWVAGRYLAEVGCPR
jgi:uncharacterized protein YraI